MAIWLVLALVLALPQLRIEGAVQGYFSNGPPRWRALWALPTQLLVMPSLLAIAYDDHGMELARWLRAGERHSARGRAECVFLYLFPTWLLLDFMLVHVRPLMLAHHAVCLMGHLVAYRLSAGFPFYFAGNVVLEMGSACCNVLCIWPHAPLSLGLYMVGMTLSNVGATVCAACWAWSVRPIPAKAFALVITVALAIVRQREAFKAWSAHS